MSKEEFLKIQTCVLKVHIHCDGCKHKVKKVLQKIDGVYKFSIDSEQGKVTVSGNVDPATLIKKLTKNGKHAEIWGAPKTNNNQQLANQFKGMQIDGDGKGGNQNKKGQKGGGGGGNHLQQQGKGSGGGGGPINQVPPQLQQQMKGIQDLKLPPLKGLNMPFNKGGGQDQKSLKSKVADDDEFDDDEFDDDEFDDDEFDEDEDDYDDDEFDDAPPNKMKPPAINSGGGLPMPNMMKNGGQMPNMTMNGQHPLLMKGGIGGGAGGNGKKGGDIGGSSNIPVQVNMGGGNNNGKKGGGGGNPNQKGGKNGGGQPHEVKQGGGHNKNGGGAKKGGSMNNEFQGMPNMIGMNAGGVSGGGPMTNMPMGHTGQMGQIPAVQGLPAGAPPTMSSGGGGNLGGPQAMHGNPYYQQQLGAAMMNQPRPIAVGNDRFQPMMYARPPPETNYMPPYNPYVQYPPPPPTYHDPYTNYYDDENSSSCSVM